MKSYYWIKKKIKWLWILVNSHFKHDKIANVDTQRPDLPDESQFRKIVGSWSRMIIIVFKKR